MRDFVGYGFEQPSFCWPNGSRLAVSVVVNFEEGAEQQVGYGDPRSESIGEVVSVVTPGTRDIGQEQIFAYGMRAGLPRMLRALDERAIPATFFMCGRAVRNVPDLARDVVARGHEPAVHGWTWRPHADYASPEDEGRDLDACLWEIEDATGRRPVGFFCRGSESVHTRSLLVERGMLYTSNAFDDDVPYRDPEHPGLVVLPYALDTNDMKFFHPNGFVRPSEMVDYVADALTTLLAEAEAGHTRLLNVGYHLRIAGRPARFQAFAGVLDRLKELGDRVWIATRQDIAEAWRHAEVP